MATTLKILQLLLTLCIILWSKPRASSSVSLAAIDEFLTCLSADIPSHLVHTPATKSFSSLLLSSAQNLRFVSAPSTRKPVAIVAATEPAHVQAAVLCGRRHGVRVRTRSGGHDYEGLSYASSLHEPFFAVLDLAALRSVHVDAARAEAWVGSGATLGELYYAVAAASRTLAFPAGTCPTVGVGGHFSGGGYGMLARKYGLSADNVLDAVVVDAGGRVLDRAAMGEDLFWAIRGGGGGSFGVVLSWKVRLVRVPETVTVVSVRRRRNESAVELIAKWQEIAPAMPRDVDLRVLIWHQRAEFNVVFLGRCRRLVGIMRARFPELGLGRADCHETTWVQSNLFLASDKIASLSMPAELLLDRRNQPRYYLKVKSDHVQQPIPRHVWENVWADWVEKPEAALIMMDPYGGRMSEISPSATPFPHREGNLYQLQLYSYWFENGTVASDKRMSWVRGLYREMEPYVSKNPRAVYVNYRDLDLGTNELDANNVTSYAKAKVWGEKYFKANFERLAAVKAKVDPTDFFRNEQSIPPLPAANRWSSM